MSRAFLLDGKGSPGAAGRSSSLATRSSSRAAVSPAGRSQHCQLTGLRPQHPSPFLPPPPSSLLSLWGNVRNWQPWRFTSTKRLCSGYHGSLGGHKQPRSFAGTARAGMQVGSPDQKKKKSSRILIFSSHFHPAQLPPFANINPRGNQ